MFFRFILCIKTDLSHFYLTLMTKFCFPLRSKRHRGCDELFWLRYWGCHCAEQGSLGSWLRKVFGLSKLKSHNETIFQSGKFLFHNCSCATYLSIKSIRLICNPVFFSRPPIESLDLWLTLQRRSRSGAMTFLIWTESHHLDSNVKTNRSDWDWLPIVICGWLVLLLMTILK